MINNKTYTDEFRSQVVADAKISGVKNASLKHGVASSSVRAWRLRIAKQGFVRDGIERPKSNKDSIKLKIIELISQL